MARACWRAGIVVCVLAGAVATLRVPVHAQGFGESLAGSGTSINESRDASAQVRIEPDGRFSIAGARVRDLIRYAYNTHDFQIVGLPEDLETRRFDLRGAAAPGGGDDSFAAALKAVLRESFKLTARNEERQMPIYVLRTARSTRRTGFGFSRAACVVDEEGPAPIMRTEPPRPCDGVRTRPGHLVARGISIAQLLMEIAPWLDRFVIDGTGLSGTFDINLRWLQDEGAPAPPRAPEALPLPEAIREQLALQLDSSRALVSMLIVDHVEAPPY